MLVLSRKNELITRVKFFVRRFFTNLSLVELTLFHYFSSKRRLWRKMEIVSVGFFFFSDLFLRKDDEVVVVLIMIIFWIGLYIIFLKYLYCIDCIFMLMVVDLCIYVIGSCLFDLDLDWYLFLIGLNCIDLLVWYEKDRLVLVYECIKQIVDWLMSCLWWLLSMMDDQSSETMLSPLPQLMSEVIVIKYGWKPIHTELLSFVVLIRA